VPLRIADVSAEAVLLAGGARAILLQLANPGVGRGVAEHSDFARRPLERLHGTLTYLYVIVYGTPAEAHRVARDVSEAHRPVRGEGYDARDERLQLWVAATLYDTAVRLYEHVFGTLDDTDAEQLLADYAIIGTTLGVPAVSWPASRAAFAEYWSRECELLRVDAPARAVAQELLHPTAGPWWLKALMPTIRVLTAGLLDPPLREAYGLPLDARRFGRLVRVIRAAYPRLPRAVRHAPMRHYLRRFRSADDRGRAEAPRP
jgi:uncharacterized protein (DUF2236 family)